MQVVEIVNLAHFLKDLLCKMSGPRVYFAIGYTAQVVQQTKRMQPCRRILPPQFLLNWPKEAMFCFCLLHPDPQLFCLNIYTVYKWGPDFSSPETFGQGPPLPSLLADQKYQLSVPI
ncbi:hypothetical protein Hanom_Chr11g00986441 [Helianthus anomalus]